MRTLTLLTLALLSSACGQGTVTLGGNSRNAANANSSSAFSGGWAPVARPGCQLKDGTPCYAPGVVQFEGWQYSTNNKNIIITSSASDANGVAYTLSPGMVFLQLDVLALNSSASSGCANVALSLEMSGATYEPESAGVFCGSAGQSVTGRLVFQVPGSLDFSGARAFSAPVSSASLVGTGATVMPAAPAICQPTPQGYVTCNCTSDGRNTSCQG